jgi:hypothetical protein
MADPDQSLSLTYPELVDEIRRWCVEKSTGTMLIATEDNQFAKILFDGGAITFLSYGQKRGADAIALLQKVGRALVKLSQGPTAAPATEASLPDTTDILAQLAAAAGTSAVAVSSRAPLDEAALGNVLKIIEAELIEHLGPLADIVWSEHLARLGKPLSAPRLAELVEGLAHEIRDPAKIKQFKDAIRAKSGGG